MRGIHGPVCLDTSLPALMLYVHCDYKTTDHGTIELENDVRLVFEKMERP